VASVCPRVGAGGEQEGRGWGVSGRLAGSGVYFRAGFAEAAGTPTEGQIGEGPSRRASVALTGVVGDGVRQAQHKKLPEVDGFAEGMGTAMEETKAVEPLDGESQGGEQPNQQ